MEVCTDDEPGYWFAAQLLSFDLDPACQEPDDLCRRVGWFIIFFVVKTDVAGAYWAIVMHQAGKTAHARH